MQKDCKIYESFCNYTNKKFVAQFLEIVTSIYETCGIFQHVSKQISLGKARPTNNRERLKQKAKF